jgi:hypothetical protein
MKDDATGHHAKSGVDTSAASCNERGRKGAVNELSNIANVEWCLLV